MSLVKPVLIFVIRMKKLLIITDHFAQNCHFRSTRIHGLVKNLPQFGWEPVVLTANAPTDLHYDLSIFEVPYEKNVTKFKRKFGLNQDVSAMEQLNNGSTFSKALSNFASDIWSELFNFPDGSKKWIGPAVKAGRKLISQFDFDAILSSFGPPSSHIVASKLKKNSGIPWVADFRDLWSQNHYSHISQLRQSRITQLEIKTLEDADAITAVSDPLRDRLRGMHGDVNVTTITNGFDIDTKSPPGITLDDKFTISYTGRIYEGGQDPTPFFDAIRCLIDTSQIKREDVLINIYGENSKWLNNKIFQSQVQEFVKQHGHIGRKESTEIQRKSQILLLLTWNNPQEQGLYSGKVFDYLAAQRPIIAIGPRQEVISDLLVETRAGHEASTRDEIQRIIKHSYEEFSANGFIKYHGEPGMIDSYSHKEMSRKFAAVLDYL